MAGVKGPGAAYIGAPQLFSLTHACLVITEALGETCYLVGSALEHPNFRDVDVRVIMQEEKFETLFGPSPDGQLSPFWSLFCVATSEYLAKRTGLNIDFQVQRMDRANKLHKGERAPLILIPFKEQQPGWRREDERADDED